MPFLASGVWLFAPNSPHVLCTYRKQLCFSDFTLHEQQVNKETKISHSKGVSYSDILQMCEAKSQVGK